MGWNLTTVNTSGDMIVFDEYDTFVRMYGADYATPRDVVKPAVTISVAWSIKENGIDILHQ